MENQDENYRVDIKVEDVEELEAENNQNNTDGVWREEHEKILIEWADKAMIYRWLHSRAHALFSYKYAWYTIPVIIISTITGTANFAQDKFPSEYATMCVLLVGGLNIIAGIVGTIQQFLKISQYMESHRVSSIAWDKFYRNIKIELAKHPKERFPANQMLKICKEEFDRLMETSPDIPVKIKIEFKETFQKTDSFKKISKPEILDYLEATSEFRYVEKENLELLKENELNKKTKLVKKNANKVSDYINTFRQIHGREPVRDEITEHFDQDINNKELKLILEQIDKSKPATGTEASSNILAMELKEFKDLANLERRGSVNNLNNI